MGLLPEISEKTLRSLLGYFYGDKEREMLTSALVDTIAKVNDADRRAKEALRLAEETHAMVRELHERAQNPYGLKTGGA